MVSTGLKVSKREVTGKKTRFLRRDGQTPAHLFGRGIESMSLQCNTEELQNMINLKGTTRLLNIKIGGEKEYRSVFIREIQRDSISGILQHVDLYQVNQTEKIKLALPIVFKGSAPALKQKNNIIEHILTELTVESLPGDLPPQIDVDLSVLTSSNQAITVRDLEINPNVTIDAQPDQIIVKISLVAEDKEAASEAAQTETATPETKTEKK
ncbi:MAG: 50S ribosomal protein L25 [Dehalococcoidia bacterium]|nr:50S ribosomal protein L25 [Dehalococcoidia bacterium]